MSYLMQLHEEHIERHQRFARAASCRQQQARPRVRTLVPKPPIKAVEFRLPNVRGIGFAVLGYGELSADEKAAIDPMYGVALLCAKHGVAVRHLVNNDRCKQYVAARREVAHFLSEQHGWSSSKIGAWMGGRDHSTILNLLGRRKPR